MEETTDLKQRWDTVKYQLIVRASYDSGDIVVEFGDGGRARVPASVLVGGDEVSPNWSGLRIEEFHIVAPSSEGDVEIPWDVIRIHSDPEFDAHWANLVRQQIPSELPA
ncbi:MAG: hypothetical protein QOF33_1986 [Thermomicrobiales bacterium]|jgi:hypothetical protein|nr:hypothetical protein [Thermomicrobiales bacterium]